MTRVGTMGLKDGKLEEATGADVDVRTGEVRNFQGEAMVFEGLSGDASLGEGTYISPRQNNGDWDYWWVIEVTDWCEAVGDGSARWLVGLSVVAPKAVMKQEREAAIQSCGWDGFEDLKGKERIHALVEILHGYGTRATLWDKTAGNPEDDDEDEDAVLQALILEAQQFATIGSGPMFGFMMDRAQNRIGSSGWDLVRGDIMAGLRRGG